MRKILVAIGTAGLALPGLADEGASSRTNPRTVELRRPRGGVLVAEKASDKTTPLVKAGPKAASKEAAPPAGERSSLKTPAKEGVAPDYSKVERSKADYSKIK